MLAGVLNQVGNFGLSPRNIKTGRNVQECAAREMFEETDLCLIGSLI